MAQPLITACIRMAQYRLPVRQTAKAKHDACERCGKKCRQVAVEESKQKGCHHQALPWLASFQKSSENESPKQELFTDRWGQGQCKEDPDEMKR